nr:uncharacterized mitochondrial protein AtMg00810-like [Tanacetum cinerariifolium]
MDQAATAMGESALLKRSMMTKMKTLLLDQTKGRKRKVQEKILNHQRNHLHPRNPPKDAEEKIADEIVKDNEHTDRKAAPNNDCIELKYNMEECYKALTDRLDWENPKVRFLVSDFQPRFIMDDPNITMEEYIILEEEKAQRHGRTFNWQTATYDMAPLPPRDQRHPWLKYQVEGYAEDIVHSYVQRLETIFGRSINRVDVLNFVRLTEGMRQTLAGRLRMVYTGDEGHELFTSNACRRLFEIRAPLVREFMLEFLSTCRMSDTEMGLDVADTLCFQLDGARRRMTWRQFILALGLHTTEEMAEDGFQAYWLGRLSTSYVFIRDPVRRLCHRMISYSISGRGQAQEKVIGVDLFYLRSMDRGTANIPYLLAQYLFRYAEGRKSGARLSEGHFIGQLMTHFGLVSDQGLRGLSVVTRELLLIDLHELGRLNICKRIGDTWTWVAPGLERQPDDAAGASKDVPAVNEDAQVDLAPIDPVDTPMVEKSKLNMDPQGKAVDPTKNHRMIGSLMYLTASRPHIQFAVCMCARYQAKPTKNHLYALKRIFCYLRGTIDIGIWYSKDSNFALITYVDANHAGCQDTQRSTSGSMQFIGEHLVIWPSKKQKSTSISSIEAKYIIPMLCSNTLNDLN